MSDRVPMTPEGHEKLEVELKRLKTTDRYEIVKEIEVARAHGDLKENAEYHAAKDKQGHIEARIRQLEDRLARAQVIDPAGQDTDQIRFGLTVDLEDSESGEQMSYTLLGEEEADAGQGRISVSSPVARALLGKAVGDVVKVKIPRGTREFEVLEIRTI